MTPRLARPVDWLAILRETFHIWIERDAFTYSAALAFFAIFSLGPVLVVFTEGAALFFDPAAVREQILSQFDVLMGHDPATAVDVMLGRAAVEMHGVIARIIAIATFVIGTTAVFVQLQDSLNRMWDVAPKPGPLIRTLLWKRVVSFALLLALGFVLVVSLALATTIHALQTYAEHHAHFPAAVFVTGNAIVSWLLVTVLFALLYRVLPDVEIPWRDVWVGALLTALLLSFRRQVGDRLLHGPERHSARVRRRGIDDRDALLGLLRVAARAARRRLHASPGAALRGAPHPGHPGRGEGGDGEEGAADVRCCHSCLSARTAFANSGTIGKRSPTTP